jgi:hypothetical protein
LCAILCASLALIGCGGPTAPSPTAAPSAAFAADARFDAAFFASFASRTQYRRPSTTIFISEKDTAKQLVPAETFASAMDAAAGLQAALGLPVDVRPLSQATSWDALKSVVLYFADTTGTQVGGYAHQFVVGVATVNYRVATFDICGGLVKTVVRHELMHALGFDHTDDPGELMFPEARYCDRLPSPREQFHARAALGVQ